MKTRRVVIAGLARNIAPVFEQTMARLERLATLFNDYRVVIYENDSNDGTDALLRDWSTRNPRIKILSEVRQDPVNPQARCLQRASRMAHYRSQYHEYIASNYSEFDAVLVADTDLQGGWSHDGIANSFGQEDWDFVGSNGLIYRRRWFKPNCTSQYDAWAFRLDEAFTPIDTKEVNHLRWSRGAPMVPVTSCFGGLGIYRTEALLAGSYGPGDCEHIELHRSMREKGYTRAFLNPSQITLYGRKHRSLDPYFIAGHDFAVNRLSLPFRPWY